MYFSNGAMKPIAFLQFVGNIKVPKNQAKLMALGEHYVQIFKVIDGDTIIVIDSDKATFHIRLAGIDAPEFSQPFGIEARDYLNSHEKYDVRIDVTGHDKYGRSIAYVYSFDDCLNEELVVRGLAWVFSKYQFPPHYLKVEEYAQAKKVGLWAQDSPQAPWDYRHSSR
jgi:micrococcal nuclease